MNVTIQSSDKTHRVSVLGCLDSATDRTKVKKILAHASPLDLVQIDFFDADLLPGEIVHALKACLDHSINLKINTYHYLLTHSLMRLGFHVHQVSVKSTHSPSTSYEVLVLAGSANSLDKILHIIEALPLSKATIFVVQHVKEDQLNLMDQLLRVRTNYRVVMPRNLQEITPETIYVAPQGHHMKVANGMVYLTRDRPVQFARPSIDALFESLASEYGDKIIAMLLCGFGRDGVDGCALLKKAGACVIIENSEECAEACVLPDAAIEAGKFDHIFTLPTMTSVAAAAICTDEFGMTNEHFGLFITAIYEQYGYDFRGYQMDSFKRRINNLMVQFGLPHFIDFQRAIFSDQSIFNRMIAEVSVGVSAFFRHPDQFRILREQIFPYLASFPVIKLWSAGCATGEEPYSLAILLEELGLLKRARLFATDFNAYLIEVAKTGIFPGKLLESSQHNYEKSGGVGSFTSFIQFNQQFLSIREDISASTLFHRHSLVDEGVFNEFQLIMCRNVMIYFKPELQKKILERFARSLHRDGFLVLGPQDGLHHIATETGFVPYIKGGHIYRLSHGGLNG